MDESRARTAPRGIRTLFEAGTVGGLSDEQLLRRFESRRDESAELAFAVLVERYGPMVLRACRAVLGDGHDAQDAFQATFLVLARRANTLWVRDSLGPWLLEVARRSASCLKAQAARRRKHERLAAAQAFRVDDEAPPGHDVASILHEEVGRLPARYRAPIVLCHLQGLTHDQAAQRLDCPVGTVRSRLARGRDRLRERLARRGLGLSAAVAAVLSSTEASTLPLPTALVQATTRAASGFLTGPLNARVRSAAATTLALQVTQAMRLSMIARSVVALTVLALAAAGAAAQVRRGTDPPEDPRHGATSPVALAPPKAERAADAAAPPADPQNVERFSVPKNGLSVLLRPIRGAKSTTLVVLYSVGGDHDPEGRSGLAHMIEHLYVTSAAGAEKARSVGEYLKRYPEGWNAQTGDRYTVVATSFPAKDLEKELRDAAARMSDLRVTADDLERERPRLLEELANMFECIPTLAALNNARELLRPSPRGGRKGGQPDQVTRITVEDVRTHWRRYYKPCNARVVLAGALDPVAARRAITAAFSDIVPGENAPAPAEPAASRFGEGRELAVAALVPDARPAVCLAYAAPQPDSPLYAPYLVLMARFMQNASKFGGQPGTMPLFVPMLDDPSILAVTTPVEPGESRPKAIARLEALVAEIVGSKLEKREGESTREALGFLLGTTSLADELLTRNVYGVAFSLGRRDQLKINPAKLGDALDSLSDGDLRRAASAVFAPSRHTSAFVALEE